MTLVEQPADHHVVGFRNIFSGAGEMDSPHLKGAVGEFFHRKVGVADLKASQ